MAECAFKNCVNHGETRIKLEDGVPEVTYHLFPKNPTLREKWLKQMNQENWRPGPSSALCSLHFTKEYFITDARGSSFLKYDAIPTEFELYQQNYPEMVETTPVSCCAYKCTNVFSPDSPVTFHPFPLDMPDLCAQWLAAMNCSQIDSDQAVLCSEHFEDVCFVFNEEGQKFLISDAVPSIFLYPDPNEEAAEQEGIGGEAEEGEMMEMQTDQVPDPNIIKFEVSEDNMELIRRHDEVVSDLMEETQRLLDLTSKRNRLEKKKRDLEMLLRATINNTPIQKAQIRAIKPLLKELQEQHQSILINCMSPCITGSIAYDTQQG